MMNVNMLKSNDKIRNKVVIFSGGLDSTYVLLKQVEKYIKKEIDSISVVHVEHFNLIEQKRKMEKETIKAILEKIKEDYDVKISLSTLNVDLTGVYPTERSLVDIDWASGGINSGQAPLWLAAILNLIPNIQYQKCEILMGENLTDDFAFPIAMSTKEKVESIAKGIRPFDDKYEFTVAFPLIFKRKENVIEEMLLEFPEYYDLCWFCEDPIETEDKSFEPCGSCDSCITHATAIQGNIMRKRDDKSKNREFLKESKEKIKTVYKKIKELNEARDEYDKMKEEL